MDFYSLQKKRFVLLDGAMGTMLPALSPGNIPIEAANLLRPSVVEDVHIRYLEAGSDIIYANTFGANSLKIRDYSAGDLIAAGVGIAKRVARSYGALAALDIGPLGELVEPLGSLSAGKAISVFKDIIHAGVAAGADLLVIETMSSLSELRLAVLSAREITDLPILVSMTFEDNGRTFAGCPVEALGAMAAALGTAAAGINCSLGPSSAAVLIKRLAASSNTPLLLKPNAGLPDSKSGGYDLDADAFVAELLPAAEFGVKFLGGCCGSTPEHIAILSKVLSKTEPKGGGTFFPAAALCSATKAVTADCPRIIGERINPSGKKRFQTALTEGDMNYILQNALKQEEDGAEILDVNVGMPGIDEEYMMERVVTALQTVTDLPLCIDSVNPHVIEAGLRAFHGVGIVNSVSGEKKTWQAVLPLVKKYGAFVVGLAMDENGLPQTAAQRVDIIRRIACACDDYGIPRERLIADCLTLTVSASMEQAHETLSALRTVKAELGIKTLLGVSNISFGLPQRETVNAAFLTMALDAGLDFAILNPASLGGAMAAYNLLSGRDSEARRFLSYAAIKDAAPQTASGESVRDLGMAIEKGLKQESLLMAAELLLIKNPGEIIETELIPALNRVGERFERQEIFLPQLLRSATAAEQVFEFINSKLAGDANENSGRGDILLATVEGDIHDIGKNIVRTVLSSYGYRVFDLGRNVSAETVLAEAAARNIKLVGLSALMTTTLPAMERTIRLLKEHKPYIKVMVGGAVLTEQYARAIGADYYASDAKGASDIARSFFTVLS